MKTKIYIASPQAFSLTFSQKQEIRSIFNKTTTVEAFNEFVLAIEAAIGKYRGIKNEINDSPNKAAMKKQLNTVKNRAESLMAEIYNCGIGSTPSQAEGLLQHNADVSNVKFIWDSNLNAEIRQASNGDTSLPEMANIMGNMVSVVSQAINNTSSLPNRETDTALPELAAEVAYLYKQTTGENPTMSVNSSYLELLMALLPLAAGHEYEDVTRIANAALKLKRIETDGLLEYQKAQQ